MMRALLYEDSDTIASAQIAMEAEQFCRSLSPALPVELHAQYVLTICFLRCVHEASNSVAGTSQGNPRSRTPPIAPSPRVRSLLSLIFRERIQSDEGDVGELVNAALNAIQIEKPGLLSNALGGIDFASDTAFESSAARQAWIKKVSEYFGQNSAPTSQTDGLLVMFSKY